MTFRWNNAPMSYQYWSNVNFGKFGLPEYRKYHTSHVYEELSRNFLLNTCGVLLVLKNPNSFCKTEELIYSTDIYSHHILYPVLTARKQCTLLLLMNLAQSQWVSVDCNTKVVNHAVCFSRKQTINGKERVVNLEKSLICAKVSILYKKWCYFFFHCKKCSMRNILSTCRDKGLSSILDNDSMALELFSVISESLGEIFCNFAVIDKNKEKVHFLRGERYRKGLLNPFAANKTSLEGTNRVFLSCKGNMIKQNTYTGLVYKHYNGHYSSVVFLHDGKQWNHEVNSVQTDISCKTSHCVDLSCDTSAFFYKSISGKCSPYSQQELSKSTVDKQTILVPCKNNETIEETFMNDLVSDCGLSADDEPIYKALLLNKQFYSFTSAFPRF